MVQCSISCVHETFNRRYDAFPYKEKVEENKRANQEKKKSSTERQ
jgi:hypothetical protein